MKTIYNVPFMVLHSLTLFLRKGAWVRVGLVLLIMLAGSITMLGQRTISSGQVVNASSIQDWESIIINAGGTLNMDISRTYPSLTSSGTGTSTITGNGNITLENNIIINAGNTLSVNTTLAALNLNTSNLINNQTARIGGTGSVTLSTAININGTNGSSITLEILDGINITTSAINGGSGNNSTTYNLIVNGSLTVTGAIETGSTGVENLSCGPNSIVRYSSSANQAVYATTYNNLTLSGSGSKTTTGVTVNGILSREGTASLSAAPTYGANATLQYNTSAATTAGVEWPATFTASGGVIIGGTGAITLNAAKVLDTNDPLVINAGATLITSNFQLTLGGNFTNNGTFTAGSSNIVIAGTMASQSISGFVTTGTVSMTKTGGTATFLGNVNGGALTINGSGGTLNLGTSLTHTFTGAWTRTNGTLHGGSSVLRLAGAVSGTGGTFTAGTGTVVFNGASQSVPALTYHNLTLSGTNAKTASGTWTISGNFNINSGVSAGLGSFTHSAGTLTLGSNGTASGSWGSTSSAATYKNNTFFGANTGIVNVSTATWSTPTVTVAPIATYTYNRTAQGPNANETTNTGTGSNYTFSYAGVTPTSYTASATRPTNAGNYTVTATVAASADGFWSSASSVATAFTIGAKALTASLTGTVSKEYDGTNAATLAPANFSIPGVELNDDVTISNTTGTYNDNNVGANKTVTVATPTLGGADAGNYVVSGTVSGNIGTITARPLSITANDASKCAGTELSLGSNAFTSNGLVTGDAITSVTLSSTGAAAAAAGGTHPIVPAAAVGTGLSNYTITYNNGTLTVRSLSATVPTIPAITYGIPQATAGSFTLTGAGVAANVTVGGVANSPFEFASSQNGSYLSSLTLSPSNGSINQELWVRLRPTSLNAGSYTESISLSAGGACSSSVQLSGTVQPRPLTVFVNPSGTTKNFDGTATAPLSLVAFSGTALQGDAITYTAAAANFDNANVGTDKSITVTGISISGAAAANYTLTNTSGTTTGTIVPLAVTITPNPNQSKKWNTSDPAFTFTNSPAFIGSDGTTGALARQAGEAVGSYPFTLGTLSASSNYTLTLAAGNFQILALTEDDAELVSSGQSDDMTSPAAWQWFDGVTTRPATKAPNLNSANVTIKNGHIIRQKNDFKVSNGKKFKLEPNARYIVEAGKKFEIDGEADFNDQEVILESNASGTAWIPEIKGQLIKATKVTVERFVPRAQTGGRWRFIALPLNGVTSIRAALAGNRPALTTATAAATEPVGNGVLLRGHNMRQADGKFDFWSDAVGRFSNIRYYTRTATGGSWSSENNTPDVSLPPNQQGYMVFFWGDRTTTAFSDASLSATTFRPTGTLKQGNQTVPINQKYVVVGNPYAAPLDLDRMYNNTGNSSLIERNFWIWDATLGTQGGYRNILWTGSSYVVTPTPQQPVQDYLTIQSGQAFFVVQNGTATGNLLIRENNKASQQANVGVFRVSNESEVATRSQSQDMGNMYVTLHQSTGTALQQTLDGALVLFGKQFSNEVNESVDVTKVNNFTENISVLRSNKYMTVEGRPFPVAGDTVAIPLWSMARRTYALEFNTAALSGRNLTAQLVDRYTGTVQPIQLDGAKTLYHFTVNADAASSSLNRFRIVFGVNSALPVEFIEVKAQARNNNVQVAWKTGYESDIDRFEVERSADGQIFSKVGSVAPQNAMNGAAYTFTDMQLPGAQLFYRIRSVDRDGSFKLSSVVRVNIEQSGRGVQVYPTVVTNRTVNISLSNMQAGEYDVLLLNNSGQALVRSRLVYAGGSSAQSINLGSSNLPAGIYQLVVRNESDYQESFRLLIQ